MTWPPDRTGSTGRGTICLALLAAAATAGCAAGQVRVFEPDDQTTAVEVETPDHGLAVGPLELPADPYGAVGSHPACPCACEASPCAGHQVPAELAALIDEIRKEAEARTAAAADAVVEVGAALALHEEWREIVKEAMSLLDSPTIVVVQLDGGGWKKVKFEDVGDMDVGAVQVASVKKSVSAKMAAALAASMESHGVPHAEASDLSGKMMEAYLEGLGY